MKSTYVIIIEKPAYNIVLDSLYGIYTMLHPLKNEEMLGKICLIREMIERKKRKRKLGLQSM